MNIMKWILFTGTWRLTNSDVEQDVRKAAREVIERGDGVLTGGATGVDYFAMDEVIKHNPTPPQVQSPASSFPHFLIVTSMTTTPTGAMNLSQKKILITLHHFSRRLKK